VRLWDRVSSTEGPENSTLGAQGPDGSPRTLIGGVGYRWHGDGSIGLIASDELERLEWPPEIDVADLGYGALYVAQDIADAQPLYERVVLLTAATRGREAGHIYHSRWQDEPRDANEIQARIYEACAGVIDVDHLLVIAQHFGALPDEVILVELEPLDVTCGEALSPQAARRLPEMIGLARSEALAPLRRAMPAGE
jgi:hydrogenase maturation protease